MELHSKQIIILWKDLNICFDQRDSFHEKCSCHFLIAKYKWKSGQKWSRIVINWFLHPFDFSNVHDSTYPLEFRGLHREYNFILLFWCYWLLSNTVEVFLTCFVSLHFSVFSRNYFETKGFVYYFLLLLVLFLTYKSDFFPHMSLSIILSSYIPLLNSNVICSNLQLPHLQAIKVSNHKSQHPVLFSL